MTGESLEESFPRGAEGKKVENDVDDVEPTASSTLSEERLIANKSG